MKLPPSVSLARAQSIYAVSNTPIYLIQKLIGDDPNVRLLSQSLPPDQLLAALEVSATKPASDLDELVLPYVLLAAVAMRDYNALKRSTGFQPHPDYKWLSYLRDVLIQMHQSVNRTAISLNQLQQGTFSISSNASAPASVRSVQ